MSVILSDSEESQIKDLEPIREANRPRCFALLNMTMRAQDAVRSY